MVAVNINQHEITFDKGDKKKIVSIMIDIGWHPTSLFSNLFLPSPGFSGRGLSMYQGYNRCLVTSFPLPCLGHRGLRSSCH